MKPQKLPWDGGYHSLYEHHAVVRDLLESAAPAALREAVDMDWSEPYKTDSYDGPAFKKRDNDVILKLRLRPQQHEVFLWLMLEFQLSPQWAMPLRVLQYVASLQEHLLARLQEDARRARRDDPQPDQEGIERQHLPPIFALVFYHGEQPWRWPTELRGLIDLPPDSPLHAWQPQLRFLLVREQEPVQGELEQDSNLASLLMRLNQCRDLPALRLVLQRLGQCLRGDHHQGLRLDLIEWVLQVLAKKHNITVSKDDLAPLRQEEPMGLEQYAEQIADQIFDDGFQKGKQDGFQEGQQDGFQKGQQDGLQKGQQEGALGARRAALLELLEGRFGEDARWAPLCQSDDLGRLQRLFKEALAAPDADAFFAAATRG